MKNALLVLLVVTGLGGCAAMAQRDELPADGQVVEDSTTDPTYPRPGPRVGIGIGSWGGRSGGGIGIGLGF